MVGPNEKDWMQKELNPAILVHVAAMLTTGPPPHWQFNRTEFCPKKSPKEKRLAIKRTLKKLSLVRKVLLVLNPYQIKTANAFF